MIWLHLLLTASTFAAFCLVVGVPLAVWTARREREVWRNEIKHRLQQQRAGERRVRR